MDYESDSVLLRQAFMWDCPNCGIENFVRAIGAEFTDDEIADLTEQIGQEGFAEIDDFVQAPRTVKCKECKNRFDTFSENEVIVDELIDEIIIEFLEDEDEDEEDED